MFHFERKSIFNQ